MEESSASPTLVQSSPAHNASPTPNSHTAIQQCHLTTGHCPVEHIGTHLSHNIINFRACLWHLVPALSLDTSPMTPQGWVLRFF